MRPRSVVLAVVVALGASACGAAASGGNTGVGSAGVAVQRAGDLTASDGDTGASLRVNAVDVQDDGVVLSLLAVNANTEEELVLADKDDPMVLEDETGQKYRARALDVAVGTLTSTAITAEFAGEPGGDAGSFILRVNPETNDSFDEPRLTIEGIPAEDTKVAGARPVSIALTDRVAHHPNGLSFTVRRIAFLGDLTEVAFRAVNGNPDAVRLNDDRMQLQDDEGRVYLVIPPQADPKMSIPGRQRLSGTLRFAGRPGPATRSLTLVVNSRGNATYDGATKPKITIPDLPVKR